MNVVAPPADDNRLRPPMLLSVEVEDEETIEWIWTHFADGRSAVTGYRVVPKLPSFLDDHLISS
jgi:hypothetical protein